MRIENDCLFLSIKVKCAILAIGHRKMGQNDTKGDRASCAVPETFQPAGGCSRHVRREAVSYVRPWRAAAGPVSCVSDVACACCCRGQQPFLAVGNMARQDCRASVPEKSEGTGTLQGPCRKKEPPGSVLRYFCQLSFIVMRSRRR